MQPSTTEDSPATAVTVHRAQPTKEQEVFAEGFMAALGRIYAQRGTPVAVRNRSPSTTRQDAFNPAAPSNFASVACPGQSPSRSSAAVSSSGITLVVTDPTVSADPEEAPPTTATIPLCVARLTASDSIDQNQFSDEEQLQSRSGRHSAGRFMNNGPIWNL